MSDLQDLYQEVILDHNRNPRNFGRPEAPTASLEGHNPLCGDRITVHITLDGETVREVTFEGQGCAISKASASLMTEAVEGKSKEEIASLMKTFQELVTSEDAPEPDIMETGEVAALAGVRRYPMRVKCATLSWHTLKALLDGNTGKVSTE